MHEIHNQAVTRVPPRLQIAENDARNGARVWNGPAITIYFDYKDIMIHIGEMHKKIKNKM